MQSGGSGSGASVPCRRPRGRPPAWARAALAGLAALIVTGAAAAQPPDRPPLPDALPAPPAAEMTAKQDATAVPDAAATAAITPAVPFDLFGAVIGMATYNTAFTAVTQGAASAATGAIGLVAVAGVAAGLVRPCSR